MGISVSSSKARKEHEGGVSLPTFPGSSSIVSRCVANLKPSPQAKAPGQINRPFFLGRLGACQSTICALPWGWQSAMNYLSNCFSPMQPRIGSTPFHQDQVIKGYPQCGLSALSGFSDAAGECGEVRWLYTPVSFSEAAGMCCVCSCLQLHQGSGSMVQPHMPTSLNKAVEECSIYACLPERVGYRKSAKTVLTSVSVSGESSSCSLPLQQKL